MVLRFEGEGTREKNVANTVWEFWGWDVGEGIKSVCRVNAVKSVCRVNAVIIQT
jgi:hypothetical protein